MKQQNEYPFAGFTQLIAQPLESSDPQSFNRIKRLFIEDALARNAPFSFLIEKLTGYAISEPQAGAAWPKILENKADMESKLSRQVDIQTAALDFMLRDSGPATAGSRSLGFARDRLKEEWGERAYLSGNHTEKLKDEMLRARRYNHSLSAIMIDIDDFSAINEMHSFGIGDEILALIAKIIRKSVRTVDSVARHSGDVFIVILPNTNKREAVELAERIRENISKRTKRIEKLAQAVTATVSAAQCEPEETSADFLGRMHGLLETGKKLKRDAVYT